MPTPSVFPGLVADREKVVPRSVYESQQGRSVVVMNRFLGSYLLRLYHAFSGDLAMAVVLAEIAHHNIGNKHGAGESRPMADADRAVDWSRLEPCNPYSIAVATGIPRETVRRKVAALVKKGWLARRPEGGVVIVPKVADHFHPEFNYDLLCGLLVTADRIRSVLGPIDAGKTA